ncbi:peroxiredoxin [Mucilaginibacter conchicola]|uniref:Peroxiredoxin n=2 Tax=Mucilaginibacter conchicola TaxID=2303333 RepID=A0A372NMP4_9SPHI|nr:peroxiredoxin [Mucilaginibacter conchicola]
MHNLNIINQIAESPVTNLELLCSGSAELRGEKEWRIRSTSGSPLFFVSDNFLEADVANPLQLIAAAWSASFISAVQIYCDYYRIGLPTPAAADAEIDLIMHYTGLRMAARLNVILQGISFEEANALVISAQHTCAYSKMLQKNIDVDINVVI